MRRTRLLPRMKEDALVMRQLLLVASNRERHEHTTAQRRKRGSLAISNDSWQENAHVQNILASSCWEKRAQRS